MDGPASSLPYTCNTCLVAFRGSDAQRDHMRTDWHLYNMKRRIASLPPVSQETFNEKVLAAKATTTAAAAKASFETTCVACQKTFYSENSYQNHIKSSKHKAREARMNRDNADDSSSVMSSTFSLGEPINKHRVGESEVAKVTETLKDTTIKEENEDEEMSDDSFSASNCLFCLQKAADVQENTEHMFKAHGMFIPEKDYLTDLEGLLRYLHRKINENSECLYCHMIRNTPEGIRTHMRDKGHCMIAFESEDEQIEIGQYYDFRSTYSDDEWESTGSEAHEEGGVKVDGEDEGWETDASSMDEDEDELDNRKSQPVVYATEYELHLPSGRSVGHRSLAKYYRQNLHNYPTAEERAERQLAIENGEIEEEEAKPRGRNLNRALVTRANGGTGMIGTTDSQKRDVMISERKERQRAIRQENRYTARINRAANHQKHFRDPLLQ
ncbi:putative C2H2 finger domain protein [Aspergillus ibericus CBS 121593]|uniref:C2H2 finger domain protein n=1 Tax=Aspergillus ibericus CBS 121593 TaxID=1448316 RepID=A0A395GQB5_9EURO|nr:C2H2 finger domain protein [Aspergillus ibericus CBS 121593]RAK97669.1 C2H2 finger domain protein [Aspergillus ibericus CBS 121593]